MIFHLLALPVLVIPVVLTTVFWLWMLVDCVKQRGLSRTQKLVWFLVILCTHLIGALAYFLMGRSQKKMAIN